MADNQFQRPQGESNAPQNMKDCGTGTGVTDSYGADLSAGATNVMTGQPRGDFLMPMEPGGGCNDGGC